jgi:hypothetical protein
MRVFLERGYLAVSFPGKTHVRTFGRARSTPRDLARMPAATLKQAFFECQGDYRNYVRLSPKSV